MRVNKQSHQCLKGIALDFLNSDLRWSGAGNKNKGQRERKWRYEKASRRRFGITHAHSFGTDTQHDHSLGNCRTMSSIIIKLE